MNPRRMIPTAELSRLLDGSYETMTARVAEAVQREAERVFGRQTQSQVLGTYKNHAIVADEAGSCRRIRFEESKDEGVKITDVERISFVPFVTQESAQDYAEQEAAKILELFFGGDPAKANERLKDLVPKMAGVTAISEDERVGRVVNALKAERTWRTIYEARLGQISKTIGDDLGVLEVDRIEPKFEKLYTGSELAPAKMESFRALVMKSLAAVRDRIESLATKVNASAKTLEGFDAVENADDRRAYEAYKSFVADLVADLGGLRDSVPDAIKNVRRVESLAKVYDRLAEGLYSYEVAGLFVEKMAKSLAELSGGD